MRKAVIFVLMIIFSLPGVSWGCVGKTIFIGYQDSRNEEILGNVLSRLISERTGTTVKLKKYASAGALVQASTSGDVDIFVLSEGQVSETAQTADKEKAKNEFNVKYNLVWLKPFVAEKGEFSVPVIRKDTLKKFPALPRLLEKLNGMVRIDRLTELSSAAQKKGMKDTVRDFLKSQNLI